MDAQIIELLKDKIDTLESKVDTRCDRIEEKVDDVLKFKWQIMGGTIVVSAIIGTIVQIAIAIYGVLKH